MRYSGDEAEVTGDDIRRFAAKFDPPPETRSSKDSPLRAGKPRDRNATGSHAPVFRTAFVAGARRRRTALVGPVRPGVLLDRRRGDRTHVIPESQGTVRVKWMVNNQNDEAVLTFVPTVIVPRRQDA